MRLKRIHLLLFSVLTGIIMSFGWQQWSTGLFVLAGFVPLLFVEEYLYENRARNKSVIFFLYSFLSFMVWNLINTWWIVHATTFGVSAAIIYSSLLMSVTAWLFHIAKRILGPTIGYFCLVVFWLSFEHFYNFSDMSWPWLNIGNAFANDVKLIQWYEYTGVYGGTLWALVINILLFKIIKEYIKERTIKPLSYNLIVAGSILVLPLVFSIVTYYTYEEEGKEFEILVIQPNIDPYNEKFDGMSKEKQLQIMLNQTKEKITKNTKYVLTPETAIEGRIWEHEMDKNEFLNMIHDEFTEYPEMAFLAGVFTRKMYREENRSSTAKPYFDQKDLYYDRYNGVIQVDTTRTFPVYHKSKLVVGVEKMPFIEDIKFMERFIIQLGGIRTSLGYDSNRTTFKNPVDDTRVGVGICYESVYGEFMSRFAKNGANIIFIITNDGWWGDTPGYRQHNSYARLRAVETRRAVGRSANTGISCLINQRGDVLQQTAYWVKDVIRGDLKSNDKITFYTKYGDYISRIAHFFSVIMLIYMLTNKLIKKKK